MQTQKQRLDEALDDLLIALDLIEHYRDRCRCACGSYPHTTDCTTVRLLAKYGRTNATKENTQ